MPKRGKKYLEAAAKVDRDKLYSRKEAVALLKSTAYTKFDPTVEVHFRLGVDPRHAEQQVRDVVNLPHGLGKTVRVLVFAEGEDAQLAKKRAQTLLLMMSLSKKSREAGQILMSPLLYHQ